MPCRLPNALCRPGTKVTQIALSGLKLGSQKFQVEADTRDVLRLRKQLEGKEEVEACGVDTGEVQLGKEEGAENGSATRWKANTFLHRIDPLK